MHFPEHVLACAAADCHGNRPLGLHVPPSGSATVKLLQQRLPLLPPLLPLLLLPLLLLPPSLLLP